MNEDLFCSSYDFTLKKSFIATKAIQPVNEAKLLVYNRQKNEIIHSKFKHLEDFLPKDLNIFLNDTKVIKARIFGKKETGGAIELLVLKSLFMKQYLVLIKARVKVNDILYFDKNLKASIIQINEDGTRIVEFYQDEKKLEFLALIKLLNKIGHIPLPPYINRVDTKEDEETYQSVFAKNYGSVAAPTASLHFTKEQLESLGKKYPINYLTLHVGAGTFKTVEVENIQEHKMHSEYFQIPYDTKKALDEAKKVLALGTTVARTIEYYIRTNKIQGECDLFLNPLNPPIKVDYLLTNFHLPKSTLIMLVSSFVGRKKTLELYKKAIEENYRFYSYGDAMLIL